MLAGKLEELHSATKEKIAENENLKNLLSLKE